MYVSIQILQRNADIKSFIENVMFVKIPEFLFTGARAPV